MKLHILVRVFQGVVDDVKISTNENEIKKAFAEYTGVDYDTWCAKDKTCELLGDCDQTNIFEADIEPSLAMMYQNVERRLTLCLQPGQGHRDMLRETEAARNELRKYIRQMGWKGAF